MISDDDRQRLLELAEEPSLPLETDRDVLRRAVSALDRYRVFMQQLERTIDRLIGGENP